MADRQKPSQRFFGPWIIVAILFIFGAALLIILDTTYRATPLRQALSGPIRAVIILIVGTLIAKVVETRLLTKSLSKLSARQRTIAGFSIRLVLYLGILLAVFAGLGIGLSSFVFGGAFLTVILGLAGQSILANLLGGIWLVLFQPFQVSDSISFITWQFPLLMPSYQHEALKPVYSGRVTDINLMYTTILTDDGDPLVLPNGIMAQAAIINRSRSGARRVSSRFDVPNEIDPKDLSKALLEDLGTWDRPPTLEMTDVGIANYSVRITLWSRETDDRVKDRILHSAWKVIARLREAKVTYNEDSTSEQVR